jgi:hypothetical protein
MKIIKSESIKSTMTSEKREIRRGELLNFSTNGDPDDLVSVAFFNGTDTLEFENAKTDDGSPWEIEHEGATYQTIEMTRGSSPGVWRFIKCIRSIPTHE